MYSIYALLDNHGIIRYVGRVKKGREMQRVREHFCRAERNPWILELKLNGIRPTMVVIDEDGSRENEEFYTDYFKYIGAPLSNKYSGQKKTKDAAKRQSESLKEAYRSGKIKPPYERGCKKDPSIGQKISKTKLEKRRLIEKT